MPEKDLFKEQRTKNNGTPHACIKNEFYFPIPYHVLIGNHIILSYMLCSQNFIVKYISTCAPPFIFLFKVVSGGVVISIDYI